MIQRQQIKRSISGFIIDHLHIDPVVLRLFHDIHTVDPSALKPHLKSFRPECSMLQLFLQSPHGTPQNTSGPFDHIFISRTAFKDRISVICGNLIQTAVYDTVSLFLRKLCPVQSLFSDFRRKFFQCHMHDISHIHSPELILCTFCNLQAILQKMCKCTGRKTLQPGSTVRGNFSIEDLCHCFSDLI